MKATLKYLRISPRKVRLIADVIRGKNVQEAQATLRFTQKRGTAPLLKLLNSAVANAKSAGKEGDMVIAKITVDEGPKFRRFMPRARGQVSEIQKKTSHITIELKEQEKPKAAAGRKKAEPATT